MWFFFKECIYCVAGVTYKVQGTVQESGSKNKS